MKKTLIITLEYPPIQGGIASYVHGLASHLDPVKTFVLAPLATQYEEKTSYTLIRRQLLAPRWFWPRWLMLFFTVRSLVRQYGIEQIMLHHLLPVGYVALLMRKMYHIPYQVFLHGTDVTADTRNSWKTRWSQTILAQSDRLVCNSLSLAERVKDLFPILSNRLTVVYPCPQEQFFAPIDKSEQEKLRDMLALSGKRVMVTVSRLAEGKGLPHLLHLLPDIVARIPNVVWLLIGTGPKQDFLIAEIQRLGLQNVVRLVGGIAQKDVPLYLSLGEQFVLLTHPDVTRGEEGFGLVFVEAAAVGLPVIAGESGGVRETLVDGVTGTIVRPSDTRVIIDTIVDLFTDTAKAKRMGAAGKEMTRTTFSWPEQLKKLGQ